MFLHSVTKLQAINLYFDYVGLSLNSLILVQLIFCCVLHITILYGESYQRIKVTQLSVVLLFIEFSLSEDCSCQASKIITWINIIRSFKKERLSGI